MEDQQRRVAAVDVDDRAGQLRKAPRVLGQGAQQQLERGPPHVQSEGVDWARIVMRFEAP